MAPALLRCAGSWNLRKDQLAKLRAVQYSCVRKMLGQVRLEGEPMDEFMATSNGAIKRLLAHHCIERWDINAHRAVYAWAGWMARLQIFDPTRLTLHVLNHWNWNYIQGIAASNQGRQLHGRKLRSWRWERPFYIYDPNWQALALDQDAWRASLKSMSLWRSVHR